MDTNREKQAAKEIDELREESAKRADPRYIKKAANQEAWADENFKILHNLTEDAVDTASYWPDSAPPKNEIPLLPIP
eukprot:2588722-Karenia_brevis.AAC.1